METVIGFIVGYLVGTSHGRAGLAKVRTSVEAIRTSPELRRLAGEATGIAGIVLKQATRGGWRAPPARSPAGCWASRRPRRRARRNPLAAARCPAR